MERVWTVDVMFMGECIITLYYESPKTKWLRKPIMPNRYVCVDSKVHSANVYVEGLFTPTEIIELGNNAIISFPHERG